jgi:hypothetical protein
MEPAKMTALLDTGFLLAVLDADDELHDICVLALTEEREPVLPDMVIPELSYLVLRELGHPALIKFLKSVVEGELLLERGRSKIWIAPQKFWRSMLIAR